MRLLAQAGIAFLVLLAGGCVAPQPQLPIPQPAIDRTVVNSYQGTEFMVLRVPEGATVEWTYVLEGVGAGRETIDGLIRAATGIIGQEAHLLAVVTVYEDNS
ncbi:MAG: hypothetical protein QXO20_08110 [Candidatus Bathyarchaeia archaeon]